MNKMQLINTEVAANNSWRQMENDENDLKKEVI